MEPKDRIYTIKNHLLDEKRSLRDRFNYVLQLVTHLEYDIEADRKREPAVNDIRILSPGIKKIQLIKAIREWTGLGLKEAKDMSEGEPTLLNYIAVRDKVVAESSLRKFVAAMKEASPGTVIQLIYDNGNTVDETAP